MFPPKRIIPVTMPLSKANLTQPRNPGNIAFGSTPYSTSPDGNDPSKMSQEVILDIQMIRPTDDQLNPAADSNSFVNLAAKMAQLSLAIELTNQAFATPKLCNTP